MSSAFLLIILGSAVGFLSTFFGVGGGIIMIPSFYYLVPNIQAGTVIGSSLTIIALNALLNILYFKKGNFKVNPVLFISLGVPAILAVTISSQIVIGLDKTLLKNIFGYVVMLVILKMLRGKNYQDSQENLIPDLKTKTQLGFIGFLGGTVAGFTGLGGGAVMGPLLAGLLKLPMHLISVYTNVAILFTALVGSASFHLQGQGETWYQIGYVDWLLVGLVFAGSQATRKIGAKANFKVNPTLKKWLFVALFFFVGIRMIVA